MIKRTYRQRVYASLYINCVIVLMVLLGSIWMMTGLIPSDEGPYSALGKEALRYFTVDSNLLMGVTALILAVRKVLVLLGRKPGYSRFISILQLASVSAVSLTFFVVLLFLGPVSPNGFSSLYQKSNFFFHLLVPLLAMFDYIFLSDNVGLRWPWCIAAMAPEILYAFYYCIPLIKYASPAGHFPKGLDWYGFFGNDIKNLVPRLLLLAALILGLCTLFWFFSEMHIRIAKKHQLQREHNISYNTISRNLVSNVATASEYYLTNVIRIICIVAPLIGMCAGIIFTTLWLTGNYTFSVAEILVFDCFCESYLVVALFVFNTCIGQDGIVITSKVRFGKIALTFLLFLQWNLISYIAPFSDFWAYSLLFILLSALFLDSRLVLINIIAQSVSIAISLIVKGEDLLPDYGADFASSMVFRITLIFLGYSLIYMLVQLIEKMLLNTLDKLSDYDVLTHALNRRKLSHSIVEAIDNFETNGELFTVAIFDLDDFKQVNDTYGHTRGDEVLVEFVRVINSAIMSTDDVFRYGGEEFLILYKCPIDIAANSCQRVLNRLKDVRFDFFPEGAFQTATVGIAQYEKGMTEEELIVLADNRLYIGKQNGKNKVVREGGRDDNENHGCC